MISVIVAALNAMPFLPEALSSIGQQEVDEAEIIVVDGGSSDGSLEVAAAAPQVRLVRQQSRGLAQARNEGLALASGDLVAFLDADDRWAPGWLASAVRYLRSAPDCEGVLGRLVRFAAAGTPTPPAYRNGWLDVPAPGYTPGALVARQSLFERVGGFDPALTVGADSDWFVRATDLGVAIDLVEEIALYKRIHDRNLSAATARYRSELLTVVRRSLLRRQTVAQPPEPPQC